MGEKAFQDYYPEQLSYCYCYCCGRMNESGLHIQSYWDGEESVCRFQPSPYHIAIPGYVYGGLIASLIDCHCTGTATERGSKNSLRLLCFSVDMRPPKMAGHLGSRAGLTHCSSPRRRHKQAGLRVPVGGFRTAGDAPSG